ncbi:hypothetical protein BTVI_136460 [Pitangus sulphuratus]|nr:hypothetical protein BTVI_136460 [Pitangus sulphuratus]
MDAGGKSSRIRAAGGKVYGDINIQGKRESSHDDISRDKMAGEEESKSQRHQSEQLSMAWLSLSYHNFRRSSDHELCTQKRLDNNYDSIHRAKIVQTWKQKTKRKVEKMSLGAVWAIGSAIHSVLNPPHCPLIQPTFPEFSCEDIMGNSVKSLAEIQVDNIHCSPLIYPASYPTVEGNEVG